MTNEDLILAFEVSQSQLDHFRKGITSEQALQPTCNGGNPVNWILGHILAERVEALGRANQDDLSQIPDLSQYTTGNSPIPQRFIPFEDLKDLVPVTFGMLQVAFSALTEDELAEIQPGTMVGKTHTLGQALFSYTQHEMYHIGQISLARYALGFQEN